MHVEFCIDILLHQCIVEFLIILMNMVFCTILSYENCSWHPVPSRPILQDSQNQFRYE